MSGRNWKNARGMEKTTLTKNSPTIIGEKNIFADSRETIVVIPVIREIVEIELAIAVINIQISNITIEAELADRYLCAISSLPLTIQSQFNVRDRAVFYSG